MQTKRETGLAPATRCNRTLVHALVVFALAGAAQAGAPGAARAKIYTVIQLSPSFVSGAINGKGQVAFTEVTGTAIRARFYDGTSVRDLGTLGGATAAASAVNDLGQVTGDSSINADGEITHAYRWSAATGMLDLSQPGFGRSHGYAINNKGQVAGFNEFNPADPYSGHGFFWSSQTGMLDVGALGPFGSVADVINDAETVAGFSEGPEGGPFSLRAFRWTRAGGIRGIGTLPSEFTFASDMNAAGHIVGESPFTPGGEPHAFLWTRRNGLIDLGTGTNNRSIAFAINDHDMVVGQTLRQFVGPAYGFVWTQETGLVELRPQSLDAFGSANDVNNRGQVLGGIDHHAFVWTREEGVTDLNTRLRGAPDGLTLIVATGISDNGSIIAIANTGLVLLVPQCGCPKAAPPVGPVAVTGAIRAGVPLSFSAAFKDIDVSDTHIANWTWGDGSTDASIISEKNGAGSATAQHTYGVPGIYTVTLTVADSSGKRTAVQRTLAVSGSGAYVAGHGWFMSPPGASGEGRKHTGIATFAVLSGLGGASFQFNASGITFRSEQIDSQSVQGPGVQFRGRGSINGTSGYHFVMRSVPGSAPGSGKDRIRIRIWHYAPASNAEVVDYDNVRGSGASITDQRGTVMGEGGVTFLSN